MIGRCPGCNVASSRSSNPAARARALTVQAAHRAARARIELAIVIPLIAVVLLANEYREQVFGLDMPVRVITAIALLILGWRLARDIGPDARAAAVPAHRPGDRRARSAS